MMATTPRKSPFKFLDPFGKDDISYFFGREGEIDKLYQAVNKNRIVLVYGLSGTGKTSLVQCGLADRFDVTDWVPFFIRRGCNLNTSLREALIKSKVIGGGTEELNHPKAVVEYLKLISKRYLRSVFLIFDQFEELLILGDEEEKTEFINTLRQIIVSGDTQFCNFIFILREEYFAQLEFLEEVIPGFSDRRMRVEHMRPTQVTEVITKSCHCFNIKFQNEDENVKQILHGLTEKSGILLPYLQIYLDQLWREDFLRSYPNGYPENGFPPLEFTTQEIQSFGDIRDVTRRFLTERMKSIQQDLKKDFPGIPENTLNNFLDAFVTDRGTKMPIPFTWKDDERIFPDSVPRVLRQMDRKLLEYCIHELEYNRILRQDASSMELAHDNIADFIYQQRTAERIKLDEIERQIITHYDEYQETKEYLSKKQVMIYEDAIPSLELDEAHIKFFKDSKRHHEKRSLMKIGLGLIIAAVAFYFLHVYQTSRLTDSRFAILYLGFIAQNLPSEFDQLRAAKYIYDRNLVSSDDQQLFQERFIKMFLSKTQQTNFSSFTKKYRKSLFKPEDFDISSNGSYIIIDTSVSTGKKNYLVYDTTGQFQIQHFLNAEYAYFINRPNILLVAFSVPVNIENQMVSLNYPNEFLLYDCAKRDTVKIWDGMQWRKTFTLNTSQLYSIEDIYNTKSDYDSYRVRYSKAGNLVIPYLLKTEDFGIFENKVRILAQGRLKVDITSSFTISNSKDEQFLMTGYFDNGYPVVQLYNEYGELINSIRGVYFADFTESGWVTYIRKRNLVMMNLSGDTSSYHVNGDINYAYADKENKTAIARSKDQVFLLNLSTGTSKAFDAALIGIDFKRRTFITQCRHKPGQLGDSLIQRDFNGNIVHVYASKQRFRDVMINSQTGDVLVLTIPYELIWLTSELQMHTGFQVSANDLYGFSKSGDVVYFIRDDYLTVFRRDQVMNLFDFDKVYAWFNKAYTKEQLQLTKDEIKKYGLYFPSDNFQWGSKN